MTEDKKIAVFIDAENISQNNFDKISAKISSCGDILVQRVYADWSRTEINSWSEVVTENPVQAIQQFHSNQKNGQDVDKAIIMDGIEISIKNPEINTICLVSSDHGYSDFVLKLRSLGKYVLGIGEKEKSGETSRYVKTFNKFIYIEDLPEVDKDILIQNDSQSDEGLTEFSLSLFIAQCFEQTQKREDETVLLSQLGETILRQKSDFNYQSYGYERLVPLLQNISGNFSYEIINDDRGVALFCKRKNVIVETKLKEDSNDDNLNKSVGTTVSEKMIEGTIFRCIKNYGFVCDKDNQEYYYYRGDAPKEIQENLEKNAKVLCRVIKEPNLEAKENKVRNGRVEIIALKEVDEK